MEILENKTIGSNASLPTIAMCEHCGSRLKVDASDIEYGAYGCGYFICPCCGKKNDVDWANECLHIGNLRYPKHYYHTFTHEDVCHYEDKEIDELVKKCVESLGDDPSDYQVISGGDVWVMVKHGEEDNEIEVFVARDFYETYFYVE